MKSTKLCALAFGLLTSSLVNADPGSVAEGQLRVHVKVARTCYVQDADLSFGTIDGLFRSDTTASTNINVRCTSGAPFLLSLDDGKNFDTGYRRMVDDEGTHYIGYTLLQPDNTTLWDKDHQVSATATGSEQSFQVNGVIHADQVAVPGDRNYNDYVTIDLYMASSL